MAGNPIFDDILPAICKSKNREALKKEKDYVPWVVNRALSYHRDSVLYANEMNKRWPLDKQMQFDYHLGVILPKDRGYRKWWKPEKSEDLDLVCEYYGFSERKGREALKILRPEDLETIRKRMDKGGVGNR